MPRTSTSSRPAARRLAAYGPTGYYDLGSGNGYAVTVDSSGNPYTIADGYYMDASSDFTVNNVYKTTFSGSSATTTTVANMSDKYGDPWDPTAIAFDGAGNFFVTDQSKYFQPNGCVFEFDSSSITAKATLTGLDGPAALAFDSSGDLYVANSGNNTVSEFAPGAATPTATLTGTTTNPLSAPSPWSSIRSAIFLSPTRAITR